MVKTNQQDIMICILLGFGNDPDFTLIPQGFFTGTGAVTIQHRRMWILHSVNTCQLMKLKKMEKKVKHKNPRSFYYFFSCGIQARAPNIGNANSGFILPNQTSYLPISKEFAVARWSASKLRIIGLLWGKSTRVLWTPSQRTSDVERLNISWCHHVFP